ncbi:unnamed protein product, partial [Closterium sp. NIES-64]
GRLEKKMAEREGSSGARCRRTTHKPAPRPLQARLEKKMAEREGSSGPVQRVHAGGAAGPPSSTSGPTHVCGEGSYGVVYKGMIDGQTVAVKQLKNPDVKAALDEIDREMEVQKRIDHPNAVRLVGYCREDRSLVYEFMANGSLEDRLLCIGGCLPSSGPERCRIAMEIAAGLQHLHTRKPPIVHRDVKPANVLLDDHFTAKLGDVGLARLMGDLAPGHSHVVRKSVIVGTEHYVDPEYLCARRGISAEIGRVFVRSGAAADAGWGGAEPEEDRCYGGEGGVDSGAGSQGW